MANKMKNLLTDEQLKLIRDIASKNARRNTHSDMMKSHKHTVQSNKKKYNRKNKHKNHEKNI
jgi:hypothetical protein